MKPMTRGLAVGALALALLPSASQAQSKVQYWPLASVTGPGINDLTGSAIWLVPDVNGDSHADVIEGDPAYAAGPTVLGRATLRSGTDLSEIWHRDGATLWGGFGHEVIGLGDLNSDGIADIGVGESQNGAGQFYILSGTDGSIIQVLSGIANGDQFGWRASDVGDTNGDGVSDFAVGAIAFNGPAPSSGAVFLYSGSNRSLLGSKSFRGTNGFGGALSAVGDNNLDGIPDLLVGDRVADAPGPIVDAGVIRVLSGTNLNTIRSVWGDTPSGLFGQNVAACGDVNGDGIAELATTAFKYGGAAPQRLVAVFSGATGALIFSRSDLKLGSQNERSIAGGCDVNRDGTPDLVIGNDQESSFAGRVYVLSGSSGQIIRQIEGESGFGYAVHSGVDVTGDGIAEIAVGAPGNTTPNSLPYAYLFSGSCGVVNPQGYYPACSSDLLHMPELTAFGCFTGSGKMEMHVNGPVGSTALILAGTGLGFTPTGGYCAVRLSGILPIAVAVPLIDNGGVYSFDAAFSIPPVTGPISVSFQVAVLNSSYLDGFGMTETATIAFE